MDIEKIIRDMAKIGAKVLFNKEASSIDNIDITKFSAEDMIAIILKRLVYEGDYNRAENILFEELSKNNSPKMLQVANNFYNLLLEKSDEELSNNNFSREEIYQGLEDVKKFTTQLNIHEILP